MRFAIILLSVLLVSCSANPIYKIHSSLPQLDNGCLPRAISCKSLLMQAGVDSRLLAYYFESGKPGHVICVFEFEGDVWIYDANGSSKVSVSIDDKFALARAAEKRGQRSDKISSASFIY